MDKEKREWSTLFGTSGIIVLIIFFILIIGDCDSMFLVLGTCIAGITLMCLGFIFNKIEDAECEKEIRESEKIREKNKKEVSEWFDSKIMEYTINPNDIISTMDRDKIYNRNISRKYYYWIRDKRLFLFPQKEDFIRWHVNINNSVDYCEENAKLIGIDISDIVYFKAIGDISYITNVESTGINIKGAAIGAVVAGDAGAIIGSRPKITSKVEEKDNRFVELKYKDDETIKTLRFDYTALDIFREIIPEKEYEYAGFTKEKRTEQDQEYTSISYTIEERFKKLNDLKHAGLITEEEFANKKKELLEQI